MARRRAIAIEIAMQTRALTCCPIHNQLYVENDADPSAAFALAVELVREQTPYVDEFDNDAHALTDLLTDILAAAPGLCPSCAAGTDLCAGRCAGLIGSISVQTPTAAFAPRACRLPDGEAPFSRDRR